MSVTIVEGLAEAYTALTGLEAVQIGNQIMVNTSGSWSAASESVIYEALTKGGAKIVGGTQYISPGASKVVGIGTDYSSIIGSRVTTTLETLPTNTRYMFKLPQQYGGNTLAVTQNVSNGARAALQNSGAQLSKTVLQPVTKMEIVQSTGGNAIQTTAKGILTKVPWNAVMVGAAAAQGIALGIDIVESNPQLVTKIYNKLAGTDIDPESIANIVENTTVWANIRDGAVFIAEDIIQAIKDVFWDEGVFSDAQFDSGLIVPENETGTIVYGDSFNWNDVPLYTSKALGSGIVTNNSYYNGRSWYGIARGGHLYAKSDVNQRFVIVRRLNTSPGIWYNYDFYLASDKTFRQRNATGTNYSGNLDSFVDISDMTKQETLNQTSVNITNAYEINEGTRLIPVISGGLATDIRDMYYFGELPYKFPILEWDGTTNISTLLRDYFDNGQGTIITPATPGTAGISKIPGAIVPTSSGSIRNDYPDWYNNGVDTIDDYDPNTGTPTNRRWFPVNIFQPTGQDEAQDGSVTTEEQIVEIIDSVDDALEDNIQNGPQAEPQPSTYPDPNPEPGTDLQQVNPNPPTVDPSDGESPDPTKPILTTALTSGLTYIYNPTITQTKALGRKLWTLNFIENLKKIFVNPMEAIVGFHILYATPKTGQEEEIVLGFYGTDVNSKIVTNQYTTVECGRVAVNELFIDARDYEPYTSVSVYMPFIGIVELQANDIINSHLHIFYNVDVLTGTCIGFIEVIKKGVVATMYQYVGNCAVQIPLSSGNYTSVITSLLSVASSAIGGGMIGGVGGAAFGGFKGLAINSTRMKGRVIQSGNLGSNAGAMAIRKPFLIIRRPVTKDAYAYNAQYGYPANKWVMLGNMKGYTRVKSVHIDFINCTDEEEQMIDSLLKEGVQF